MRQLALLKNLSSTEKVVSLALGTAVGVGAAVASQQFLPTSERERALDAKGIRTLSATEARATFAPMAFIGAAAIGAGIGKRSQTAALTTASLGAAAMLASTGATAMVNSDGPSAEKYLRTMGLLSGVAGVGFAIGAVEKIPINRAKCVGLGLIGVAIGAFLPDTASYVGSLPADIKRSVELRD